MIDRVDPFLSLIKQPRAKAVIPFGPGSAHKERKHSKLSASGSERWFECPGSVQLSEGLPDKSNQWSIEGTLAHEVLEAFLLIYLSGNDGASIDELTHVFEGKPKEMLDLGGKAAQFISELHNSLPGSDCQVETRVSLPFIHPEMFGTFDGAVLDYFGTLHVFDYKYGVSPVSPVGNLQMIFYALGMAYLHHWNFKKVRLWIIQPRIRGYEGPLFWDLSITDLKGYVAKFKAAVERVEKYPDRYTEGPWCHWCKAKAICPLKREAKGLKAGQIFSLAEPKKSEIEPFGEGYGFMKRIELLNLDCETALMLMENESIDLTVTSPPYDSLRAYAGLPFEKFKKVAEELYRVTKKGGVVVWVVGDATVKGSESGTSFRQALYFKECGFNLHDTMIFYRKNPPLTHARYEQHFEYMFVFTSGKLKTFNPILEDKDYPERRLNKSFRRERDGSFDKGFSSDKTKKIKGNIWRYAAGGGHLTKDKINHPAIFPESLAHDHVLSWSNPGDTVFDPFLGSGTTGKMAVALKRNFIGVELDEKYFKMAQERIGNVK